MKISELPTPAIVLDRHRLARNIGRMRDHLATLGVPLRPHMKTAKSMEVAALATAGQPGGITVSTLREAEYFAENGFLDILYAVGVSPDKLERAAALQARGATITLVLDSPRMADLIGSRAAELGATFPILIEVDTDGHRAGTGPDETDLIETARTVHAHPNLRLGGIMTHAGSSYGCSTEASLTAMAEQERAGAVRAADRIRAVGLPCPVVSVGSTPTAYFAQDLTGVTEVRAGIYMLCDHAMVGLGVAEPADIAVAVVTTVISHRRAFDRIIVDAGGLALSKDRGSGARPGVASYGFARAMSDEALRIPVVGTNQEHGLIEANAADFERVPIGSKMLIEPYHACMTAAAYDRYYVTDDGVNVAAVWDRCNGW